MEWLEFLLNKTRYQIRTGLLEHSELAKLSYIYINVQIKFIFSCEISCSGYMSPEYAMEGIFSTKSDVYSFGVLLLEIVSGRKNTSFYDDDHPLNLVGHVCNIKFGKFVF